MSNNVLTLTDSEYPLWDMFAHLDIIEYDESMSWDLLFLSKLSSKISDALYYTYPADNSNTEASLSFFHRYEMPELFYSGDYPGIYSPIALLVKDEYFMGIKNVARISEYYIIIVQTSYTEI